MGVGGAADTGGIHKKLAVSKARIARSAKRIAVNVVNELLHQ